MKKLFVILVLFFLTANGNGQADTSTGPIYNKPANGSNIKQPGPSNGAKYFLLTNKETVLSYAVLFCLLFILVLEVWLVQKMRISEDNSVKLFVITLVLLGTLFIIMAGYDEKIIAPVFGLFGTIVGYLFGKSSK